MMRLLDLYCCEGGASTGYARAGFEVIGVDLFDKFSIKRYPFEAIRSDAIEFLEIHGYEFDVIHASPPCQHASAGTRALDRSRYPELITPTRQALLRLGKPYILENVRGSSLHDPIELCGCMFNMTAIDDDGVLLHLQRARLFESNMPLTPPAPHDHSDHEWVGGSYGGARKNKYEAKYERKGGYVPSIPVQKKLLGIDWMTQRGMFQAIPPTYTEWVGRQVIQYLSSGKISPPVRDTFSK